MTVRVVIADDQHLVRTGFRMILSTQPDIEVVGEASTGSEAVRVTEAQRPDLILMDIRMPGMDGITATKRIVSGRCGPSTRVVILTTFDLDEYVLDALRAGASGFLLKDLPAEQLVSHVRMAGNGDALLAPSITRRLIEQFVTTPSPADPAPYLDKLSAREVDVYRLLARGLSNREIGDELIIGETTVKTHVTRLLAKLGLRDRIQAVILAYETGLVSPGERT
jgi:DNA-binding NarL/FixJ family response regulator